MPAASLGGCIAEVLAKGILSIDDDRWSTDDLALPQELLGVCSLPTMGCLRTALEYLTNGLLDWKSLLHQICCPQQAQVERPVEKWLAKNPKIPSSPVLT